MNKSNRKKLVKDERKKMPKTEKKVSKLPLFVKDDSIEADCTIDPVVFMWLIATQHAEGKKELAGYFYIDADRDITWATIGDVGSAGNVDYSGESWSDSIAECEEATSSVPNGQIHSHPGLSCFWSSKDDTDQKEFCDMIAEIVKDEYEYNFVVYDAFGLSFLVRRIIGKGNIVRYNDGKVYAFGIPITAPSNAVVSSYNMQPNTSVVKTTSITPTASTVAKSSVPYLFCREALSSDLGDWSKINTIESEMLGKLYAIEVWSLCVEFPKLHAQIASAYSRIVAKGKAKFFSSNATATSLARMLDNGHQYFTSYLFAASFAEIEKFAKLKPVINYRKPDSCLFVLTTKYDIVTCEYFQTKSPEEDTFFSSEYPSTYWNTGSIPKSLKQVMSFGDRGYGGSDNPIGKALDDRINTGNVIPLDANMQVGIGLCSSLEKVQVYNYFLYHFPDATLLHKEILSACESGELAPNPEKITGIAEDVVKCNGDHLAIFDLLTDLDFREIMAIFDKMRKSNKSEALDDFYFVVNGLIPFCLIETESEACINLASRLGVLSEYVLYNDSTMKDDEGGVVVQAGEDLIVTSSDMPDEEANTDLYPGWEQFEHMGV